MTIVYSVSLPLHTRDWKLWDAEHPWVKKLKGFKGEDPADFDKDAKALFGASIGHGLKPVPVEQITSTLHPSTVKGIPSKDRTAEYAGRDLHAENAWPQRNGQSRYGVVTFDNQGRVLLREPTNHFDGYSWTFPKGHPDKGEHPLESARRENVEETGHQPPIVGHIPGGFGGSATGSQQHFYLAHDTTGVVDGKAMSDNGETAHLKWADPMEALQSISTSTNLSGRYRDLQILKAAYESYGKLHPEHQFPTIHLPPPPPKPVPWSLKGGLFRPTDLPPAPKPSTSWGKSGKPKYTPAQQQFLKSTQKAAITTTAQELGLPAGTKDPWAEIMAKSKGKTGKGKRSAVGLTVHLEELETRDWAKWHAEHPYVPHPRQKSESAAEYDARLKTDYKSWLDDGGKVTGPLSSAEFKTLAAKHGIRGTRVTTYNNAAVKHFQEAKAGPKAHDEAALRATAATHRRAAAKAKAAGDSHGQTVHLAATHAYTEAAKQARGPIRPPKVDRAAAEKATNQQVHTMAHETATAIDKGADQHLFSEEEAAKLHARVAELESKITVEKHKDARVGFIIKLAETAGVVALTIATGGLALPALLSVMAFMVPALGSEATHIALARKQRKAAAAVMPSRSEPPLETRDWKKWHEEHPYVAHPRKKGESAHDYDQRLKRQYKDWLQSDTGSLEGRKRMMFAKAQSDALSKAQLKADKIPVKDRGQRFSGKRPMTDAEYEQHRHHVEYEATRHGADDLMNSPFSTHNSEDRVDGAEGAYTPARQAQQKEIIDDIMKRAESVPNEHKAIIMGGPGGAGKSTILRRNAADPNSTASKLGIKYAHYAEADDPANHIHKGDGIGEPTNYVTLNPDDIKTEMARRGMVPTIDHLSPMEAAGPFTHEEASQMVQRIADRLTAQGKNVIWDITLNSEKSGITRVDALRHTPGGYHIAGAFVDVGLATSDANARARHRHGQDDFNAGKPGAVGGRFVPSGLITHAVDPAGKFSSVNRASFEKLKAKGIFDHTLTYNNEGYAGELLSESGKSLATRAGTSTMPSESDITSQIKAYRAGTTDFPTLTKSLAERTYAAPSHFDRADMNSMDLEDVDRTEPGTWNEVAHANDTGLLTDNEYGAIHAAMCAHHGVPA